MAELFPDGEVRTCVQGALLDWYAAARRDLPWRRTRDPYRIWVSEVMLQQTQVPTALPYYLRFIEEYPTIEALASTDLDSILALWQGLGYYARARNLHAAARLVVARHDGMVPDDPAALRALPGVGPYIAAAILSIAFAQDVAAIDTNATRVLCRLFDYAGDLTRAEGKQALRAYADRLLPHGRAGEHNAAMMELGATICLPRVPRCPGCPVAAWCLARERGTEQDRPLRTVKRPVPTRTMAAAWCLYRAGNGGEAAGPERLLLVRRRPEGLLGGLWELPSSEVDPGEAPEEVLYGALREHLGLVPSIGEHVADVHHAYSHFKVVVGIYRCQADGTARAAGPWDEARAIVPAERASIGLTGVATRALALLGWPGAESA